MASWEAFAASRLEWDPSVAVDVDRLFVSYARWAAMRGAPMLAEAQVLAWWQAQGATVRTGAVSHVTAVAGVQVVT